MPQAQVPTPIPGCVIVLAIEAVSAAQPPRMSQPSSTQPASPAGASPAPANADTQDETAPAAADPILCHHCGRTASNGISCEGYCVADSGY